MHCMSENEKRTQCTEFKKIAIIMYENGNRKMNTWKYCLFMECVRHFHTHICNLIAIVWKKCSEHLQSFHPVIIYKYLFFLLSLFYYSWFFFSLLLFHFKMCYSQNCRHGMKESNAIEEIVSKRTKWQFHLSFRAEILFLWNSRRLNDRAKSSFTWFCTHFRQITLQTLWTTIFYPILR